MGIWGCHGVGPDIPPLRGFPALFCMSKASLRNVNRRDDPVRAHVNRAFITELLEPDLQTAPY